MTCHFKVGQRVVCINDYWFDLDNIGNPLAPGPAKGDIVTISDITLVEKWDHVFLTFVEWPKDQFGYDSFRPLTDISIFEQMLNRVPTKEREPA